MKILLFVILIANIMGCATYDRKFLDTKGHTQAEYVLYDRQCSRYHYFGEGHKALDTEYYYACMEQYGYKMEVKQTGVSYNPFN